MEKSIRRKVGSENQDMIGAHARTTRDSIGLTFPKDITLPDERFEAVVKNGVMEISVGKSGISGWIADGVTTLEFSRKRMKGCPPLANGNKVWVEPIMSRPEAPFLLMLDISGLIDVPLCKPVQQDLLSPDRPLYEAQVRVARQAVDVAKNKISQMIAAGCHVEFNGIKMTAENIGDHFDLQVWAKL